MFLNEEAAGVTDALHDQIHEKQDKSWQLSNRKGDVHQGSVLIPCSKLLY